METITREYSVFSFEELSESAKARALQWHRETLDSFWSEYVTDDAKHIASLMGWRIENIYWSGFWCQGDGACFTGILDYAKGCAKQVYAYAPKDAELSTIAKDWQSLQARNFYSIRAIVRHRGHYSHSGCTEFECEDIRGQSMWVKDETEKEIKRIARQFMDWIYRSLEREYEFRTSAETFSEDCEANGWRFTADGKFFGGAE